MNHVHQLPGSISQSSLGRLQLRMRRVLRSPGDQHAPKPNPSCGDAGDHQQIRRGTEPGIHSGIRQPDPGEIHLSPAEIEFAVKRNLIP